MTFLYCSSGMRWFIVRCQQFTRSVDDKMMVKNEYHVVK